VTHVVGQFAPRDGRGDGRRTVLGRQRRPRPRHRRGDDPVTALLLGLVHRCVGAVDEPPQRVGRELAVDRLGQRDADRGGDRMTVGRATARDRRPEPFGEVGRLVRVAHQTQHHQLLATGPGEDVAGADGGAECPGHGPQHRVPGGVPVGVVEQLEVVEVQHHRRHAGAVAPGLAPQPGRLLDEDAAVEQAGERVEPGERLGGHEQPLHPSAEDEDTERAGVEHAGAHPYLDAEADGVVVARPERHRAGGRRREHVAAQLPGPEEPGRDEGGEQQHERGRVAERILDAQRDDGVDEVTQENEREHVPAAGPSPDDQRHGHENQQAHGRGVDPASGSRAQDPVDEEVDRAHGRSGDEQCGEGERRDPVLGAAADRGRTRNGGAGVQVVLPPAGHDRRMPYRRRSVTVVERASSPDAATGGRPRSPRGADRPAGLPG
jgi:hypothetical protein